MCMRERERENKLRKKLYLDKYEHGKYEFNKKIMYSLLF